MDVFQLLLFMPLFTASTHDKNLANIELDSVHIHLRVFLLTFAIKNNHASPRKTFKITCPHGLSEVYGNMVLVGVATTGIREHFFIYVNDFDIITGKGRFLPQLYQLDIIAVE